MATGLCRDGREPSVLCIATVIYNLHISRTAKSGHKTRKGKEPQIDVQAGKGLKTRRKPCLARGKRAGHASSLVTGPMHV